MYIGFKDVKWMLWPLTVYFERVTFSTTPALHSPSYVYSYSLLSPVSLSRSRFSRVDRGQGCSLRLFRLASFRVIFTSLPSAPLSTMKDYSWDMTQATGCWWCHLRVMDGTESRRRMMCQLHLTPCRDFHTPLTSWRVFAIYTGLTWFLACAMSLAF